MRKLTFFAVPPRGEISPKVKLLGGVPFKARPKSLIFWEILPWSLKHNFPRRILTSAVILRLRYCSNYCNILFSFHLRITFDENVGWRNYIRVALTKAVGALTKACQAFNQEYRRDVQFWTLLRSCNKSPGWRRRQKRENHNGILDFGHVRRLAALLWMLYYYRAWCAPCHRKSLLDSNVRHCRVPEGHTMERLGWITPRPHI